MVFLSWTRPSPAQQKACIHKYNSLSLSLSLSLSHNLSVHRSEGFNYDPKYQGASSQPLSSSNKEELTKNGFFLNHSRILLGSGPQTFQNAKTALQTWRHLALNWAFVDPKTSIEVGTKFCICVKELLPWVMLPLQVSFVANDSSSSVGRRGHKRATFGFGSGTLHGHLLAGEECFSIELDEDNQVWYEISSFSKPAHFLSFIGYPYVQLRQKYFAHQSTQSILKHITAQPVAK